MAVDLGSFNFEKVVVFMQSSGFYDYLLPFLLIFAIVFAALEKTQVLGKDKTNINIVVSVVIGFLLIVQQGIVQTINSFLPKVSLLLVVILMVLMVFALIAGRNHKGFTGMMFVIACIVVFIAIMLSLTSSIPGADGFLSSDDAQSLLTWALPIGIFLLAIYILTRPNRPQNERQSTTDRWERIANQLGGGRPEGH